MNIIQRRFIRQAIQLHEAVVDFEVSDREFIEDWEISKERFKEMLNELRMEII
jgi:hypothetical protein